MKQPHTKQHRGMTTGEVLVIVAVSSVLILAIMNAVAFFYQSNAYTVSQAYQVSHARRGIEHMVRDLREMTFADDGTFPLAVMYAHSVGFYSDIDRDDSVEYISYDLDTTTLYKYIYNATGSPPTYNLTTPDETHIISEYVQNESDGVYTFTYYDETGLEVSAGGVVTDIRYIETRLIINVDPVRFPDDFMLRSSAALRNLKENF